MLFFILGNGPDIRPLDREDFLVACHFERSRAVSRAVQKMRNSRLDTNTSANTFLMIKELLERKICRTPTLVKIGAFL